MTKTKQKQLLILALYIILSCGIVLLLKPAYLYSVLLVLGPPSFLNFYWLDEAKPKVLLFSLATTLIFAPPIELISRLANAWDVQSTLPRILGLIPLENMIFAFFNFFWVISFYLYFINNNKNPKLSKRFYVLVLLYCLLFGMVFTIFAINRQVIAANYFVVAIIVLIVPGFLIFWRKVDLLRKTLIPMLFFAFVFFAYELVSLKIGSWWWPGTYLLPVSFLGKPFPLDDIIIWYFLSTPVLIGGYEYFMNTHTG